MAFPKCLLKWTNLRKRLLSLISQKEEPEKAFAVESSDVLFPRQKKGEQSSDVFWKDDWQPFNRGLMTDQHKHEEQRHSPEPWLSALHMSAKVRCGLSDLRLEGFCLYISAGMLTEDDPFPFLAILPIISLFLSHIGALQTTMNYSQHQKMCKDIAKGNS